MLEGGKQEREGPNGDSPVAKSHKMFGEALYSHLQNTNLKIETTTTCV